MVVIAAQLPAAVPTATPVVLYRITPVWSEQNDRVPVFTLEGVAFDSYAWFAPATGVFPTAANVYPLFAPADSTGSIRHAVVDEAVHPTAPPIFDNAAP